MDLGGVHVLGPSLHDQLCEKVDPEDGIEPCTACGAPESRFDFTRMSALIISGLPTAMPIRHPVMLKVLESE